MSTSLPETQGLDHPRRPRRLGRKIAIIGGAIVLAAGIGGALSNNGDESISPSAPNAAQTSDRSEHSSAPTNKATDDHTPHVGPNGSVIVDTLTWKVAGAYTAKTIGSNQYAMETADGVYVVVNLDVLNGKDESVTLTSSMVTLRAGDAKYEPDSSGSFAVAVDGAETFVLKDLGPAVATNGTVVFDVAPEALNRTPEVCFGELGFGSTEGCIRLNV